MWPSRSWFFCATDRQHRCYNDAHPYLPYLCWKPFQITVSKKLKRVILVLRTVVVCIWLHVAFNTWLPSFRRAGCPHPQKKYCVPHKVLKTWALHMSVWVTECAMNIYPIISPHVVAEIVMFQDSPRRGTYQLLWTTVPLNSTSGKHHSFVILFSAFRIVHREKRMSFWKAIYVTQLKIYFLDIV